MKWIVTGAAGFIGCNAVSALVEAGDEVVAFDDLSRPGSAANLEWLRAKAPELEFVRADVAEGAAVERLVEEHSDASVVLHLAGQVAVTTSIRDPRADFQTNALGTFNVCEAVRLHAPEALLVNASTNKVYGSELGEIVLRGGRWRDETFADGIDESAPLDFHSPYACSKGVADQYVLDYTRIYGLRTVSARQSCIYGPRQFGIEDQGWLAWFAVATLAGVPITIYGDGCQVRDVLDVSDLVRFYRMCAENPDRVAGRAVNVGGGPSNALSLLELLGMLEQRLGRAPETRFAEARLGDQRVYISDVGLARDLLGWEPVVPIEEGLARLVGWLEENLAQVAAALGPEKLPSGAASHS